MINDFLTKFLSKNPIMDDYGLKYNHTFSEEILKIKDNYSVSQLSNKVLIFIQFLFFVKILNFSPYIICEVTSDLLEGFL